MRAEILGVAFVGLCAQLACSGGASLAVVDTGVDAAADAPTAGMCGADIPPGQACNALVPNGAAVTPTCTTGTVPTGQGGTIVDGTYVLTAQTYYNASTCPTLALRQTVVFAGGCLQLAAGPAPLDLTASGTFTVAGSSFNLTRTCIHLSADGATFMESGLPQTFTATGTTFTLFSHSAASTPIAYSAVFTKQ